MAIVEVDHITKSYGDLIAVNDVSFAIEKGEIFGLVGPNGAGKTTLIEMIEGLRTPDRGSIKALGLDPTKQGDELRERIGVLLQATSIQPDIKVREALKLFASFYENAPSVDDLPQMLSLEDKLGTRFKKLSGGLKQASIPVTLITDSMAGYFMNQKRIDCAIVGADRIAANGDVANKIGTYTLAVLAKENNIPFYVAAPTSTIDLSLTSGTEIPVEERAPEEVTHIRGVPIAPEGIKVANPAFDITPHSYISAIITEEGIIREPYTKELRKQVREGKKS